MNMTSGKVSGKKTGIAAVAIVVIAILAVYSYISMTTPAIPNPNTFIFATAEPMVSLDPAQTTANTDYRETYLMYDRLVTYRGSSTTPEQMLATSWESSSDGLVWTFHLIEGVRFHDGTPLNATAVAFSFSRAMKIGLSAGMLSGIIDENSVEAIDTYTVRFNLKDRYAPFLATLGVQAFGIVSPKVMEHEVNGDLGKAWLSQNEAGSGPFKLKEYVPNERLVLSAVKDYWGGAPRIDEMVVRIVTEGSTQRLMLERGEIDGAETIPTVAMNELKKSADFKVVEDAGFAITFLIINTQKGPLSDVRVRKAIAYALDYDGIINDIFLGRATRLRSPLPQGFPGHDASLPLYAHNVTRAAELLAAAGYANGFELNMMIAPFEDWIKIATAVQSVFGQLNITVNIQQFSWPTYIDNLVAGAHDLALMGWTPDYADPNMQTWWYFYSENAGPGWNFAFYNNTRVDQLLLEGRSEYDATRRTEIYNEIQSIVVDEVPYVWISQGLGYGGLVFRSWVHGYTFNPLNAWYIPADVVYKAP